MNAAPVACLGGDVPECCAPSGAMTRGERQRRRQAALKARTPYTCPHCGAGGPAPAFIRGCDAWMCADWRCARIFMVED